MITVGVAFIDAKFKMGYQLLYLGAVIVDCTIAENFFRMLR